MGDGGGILRNGAHIGLRGAAGRRNSQRCHHHPGFELKEQAEEGMFLCLFWAYHLFTQTESCREEGDGGNNPDTKSV